jgi:hypothetical protein
MSKSKHKVKKLTDEQYNEYITTLKNTPSLYNADGSLAVPSEVKPERKKEE